MGPAVRMLSTFMRVTNSSKSSRHGCQRSPSASAQTSAVHKLSAPAKPSQPSHLRTAPCCLQHSRHLMPSLLGSPIRPALSCLSTQFSKSTSDIRCMHAGWRRLPEDLYELKDPAPSAWASRGPCGSGAKGAVRVTQIRGQPAWQPRAPTYPFPETEHLPNTWPCPGCWGPPS